MTSNLIQTIDCPECGKPLVIYHDRNNMRIFATCDRKECSFHLKELKVSSTDLELLFYKKYYKENNGIERIIQ